jgi:nitrogen fixation protein FixH
MKFAIALATVLAFATPAEAQHAHGSKGPNGGMMEDVAGVHAELLTSGNAITVNILDEGNKPVSTKGVTASALVVNGADRETVTLSQSGENALKGETKKAIAPNTQITLMIKTAAGKSGQARYKIQK